MIAGVNICYASEVDHINNSNGNGNYKETFSLLGAGPVIGCIYNINSRFSIQTELGCFYGYANNKKDDAGTITNMIGSGWGSAALQRLLSINIYYNFGRKH